MSAYTQRDYEAIEAAVLESPRGRWFLGEYTRRNRAADTLMLLDAIRKLERGVAEHGSDRVSEEFAAELQGLSGAIGSILAGIGGESQDAAELIGHVRNAAEQLSQVKSRIDALLTARSSSPAAEDEALTSENLQFFRGDEGLFATAPAQSPDNSPSLAVVGEEQGRTRPLRNQPDPGAAPLTSAPKGDPKDRIVFIRRASSSETSIPLADEPDDEFAAGQSQPGS